MPNTSSCVALVKVEAPGRGRTWERDAMREAFRQVCELISEGKTKLEACETIGMPYRSYARAMIEDDACWQMHARARLDQTHALADEALRLARIASPNLVAAQDKRTYLDTVKWLCAKVHPRAYGDPRQLEATGTDGALVNRARQAWQIGKRSVEF